MVNTSERERAWMPTSTQENAAVSIHLLIGVERTDPRRQGIFLSAKTPEGIPVAPWLRYLKENCQKPLLSLIAAITLEAMCVECVLIAIQGHLHDVAGVQPHILLFHREGYLGGGTA